MALASASVLVAVVQLVAVVASVSAPLFRSFLRNRCLLRHMCFLSWHFFMGISMRLLFIYFFRQNNFHTWDNIIWVGKMDIEPLQIFKRNAVLFRNLPQCVSLLNNMNTQFFPPFLSTYHMFNVAFGYKNFSKFEMLHGTLLLKEYSFLYYEQR